MNAGDWIALAALVIVSLGHVRGLKHDGTGWVKELIQGCNKRVDEVVAKFEAYKTQMDNTLQDHLVWRRDFDDFKREQKEDVQRLEGKVENLCRRIDELPEKLMNLIRKQ